MGVVQAPVAETVYNFEVADSHTYFVGESGIWAHNSCSGAAGAGARKRGPGNVANEKGVRIDINSKDHSPSHTHVKSGSRNTRVGQNGKPLKREGVD